METPVDVAERIARECAREKTEAYADPEGGEWEAWGSPLPGDIELLGDQLGGEDGEVDQATMEAFIGEYRREIEAIADERGWTRGDAAPAADGPCHLAWHMGMAQMGPVRYLLIPANLGAWRGVGQFRTIHESGEPAGRLYARIEQVCSLRNTATEDGQESSQERALVATLRSRAGEAGHALPEIELTSAMPTWSGYNRGAWAPSASDLQPAELKRLRKAAGLSQEALARRLDCSASTVAKWESGVNGISAISARAIRSVLAS